MFDEHGYSSVTRRSMIEGPEFKPEDARSTGTTWRKIYLDTIELGAKGYMKYRTVPAYPQVDHEIDIAIQNIVSQAEDAPRRRCSRRSRTRLTPAQARRREALSALDRADARPLRGWAAAAAPRVSLGACCRRCWCWRRSRSARRSTWSSPA